MVNWQVTVTTIYCDAVDDDVTLMVNKDWTTKCVSYQRYRQPSKEMRKLMQFIKRDEGIESAEYAVLGALIILGIIAAVTALGGGISDTFTTIAAVFPVGS